MKTFLVLPLVALLAACSSFNDRGPVATSNAPAAIGPYSQAIRAGGLYFVSGQIPLDPATGKITGTAIADQTKQVMDNVAAILAANNMTMADVVSTTVYLRDLQDFAAMNTVYGTYFPSNPPARATIQAARLPRDVAVEISVTAAR